MGKCSVKILGVEGGGLHQKWGKRVQGVGNKLRAQEEL